MPKSSRPMTALLKKKEWHYKHIIEMIMKDDQYTALPDLVPTRRKARAWTAMIAALLECITPTVENLFNVYL